METALSRMVLQHRTAPAAVRAAIGCLVALLSIGVAGEALAGTRIWTGTSGTTSLWTDANNWSGGTPDSNDSLLFSGTLRLTSTNNIAITTNGTNQFLNFSNTAGAFVLTGTGMSLNGNGGANATIISTTSSNRQTISLAFLGVTGNAQAFTINSGSGGLLITSTVTGTQGLNFSATSGSNARTTLTGANTYSGTTTVVSGALNIQNATGLGGTANGTTVQSGAALELQSGSGITIGAEALSLSGAGISSGGALRNISGTNTYGGLITLSASSTIGSDAGVLTLSGSIRGTAQNLTIAGAGDTTITGTIATTTGTLAKSGAGTLTLSAANTYTGLTTISGGTLAYGVANALSTGGVTLNGGVLDIASFSDSVGQVTLTSGNIVGTTGTLTSTANFSTTSGTISATLGGTNFGIAQQGSGKTVVTSSNAFTGGSTVAAGGVLNVRNAFALGTTGTATVSSGGALELENSGTLARRLSLSGTGVSNGGALRNVSGTNGISAGITLAGATRINSDAGLLTLSGTVGGTNVNLTFGGAGDTTVSNTISIGTGGIIKDGAGKLTLSGTAGTTTGNSSFSAGTVAIGGTNIFTGATGTIAFTNGATLQSIGAGNPSIARPISLGAGGGAVDLAGGVITLTGSITGGGGLVKNGGNDFILSQTTGTNNIGNLTINAGRLFVDRLLNINSSTVTVNNNGYLTFQTGITGSFTPANTITINSGGGITTRSGTLTLSSTAVTLPSAGSVIFNYDDQATGQIVVNGTYPTLSGSLAIQVGAVNTNAATIGAVTINAPITGNFPLSKEYLGRLVLGGSNSFTGGLAVNGGVLQLGNANALNPSGTNAVSVASGAILRLNGFSPTIAGLTGSGTVDNGNATAAALTIGLTSGTSQFDGIIANGASGTTSLVKSGGGTQILTAANTYSGSTSITGGALNVQNASALGTSTGTVTVGSGAALQLQGGVTISRPLSLGSTGVNADGGLRSISGSNTYSGPITTTAAVGFGVDSGTLTLSGSLGGSNSFTKYGSGLLVLTGTDNITGAHTISGGTYQIGSTGVLSPGGGVVMNVNNATLDLNGRSATIGANGNPTSSLTGGLITTASGTVSLFSTGTFTTLTTNASANSSTISGNLSLGGTSAVFTVNDGAATDDLVVSAVISNGGLTKNGAGQMKLTGANTYGGATTVGAGTLLLGANNALSGSTAVTVAGGVLDGGGFTNSVGSFAITSGTYTGAGTLTAPTYSLGGGTVSGTLGGGTLNVAANTTLSGSSAAGVVNLNAGTLALGAAHVLSSTAAVSGLGGGSMSLGGDLTIGSLSGTAGVSLGSSTLTVGGLNTSTIYPGTISGAGGLTKVGSGTFTLFENTYTGTTTISTGALNIQNGSALGGTGAGTIVSAGAALQLQGGITVTGEPLTLSGSGVASTGVLRNISGTNTYAGVISLAGSERVFIFSDAGLLTLNTGTITGADLSLRTGGTGDMTISSVIATGTGGLTKGGLGALTLSGSNTYTGATIINNGVLVLGASNVLSDLNDLSMLAGGINLNGNTDTVASLTMSTGSIFGSGKLTAATYTLGNAVVAGNLGTGTMIVTGTAAALNAALNATADVTAVNLNTGTNTSTLTLGGANRFTNPQVALTGSAGGAITLGGTESVGSLAGGFATNLGSNTLTTGNNNTSTTYSGTISGAGGLTKVGSGTFTLAGDNSFSGTTAIGAGAVSVASVASGATNQPLGTGNTLNLGVAGTSSGQFVYTGGAGTLSKNVFALGNGTDTIQNQGTGLLTLSGTLTKNGTVLRLWGGAQGITVTGLITGTLANSDLAVQNGLTTLSTTGSYTGPTFINSSGTLALGISNAIPSNSAVTIGGTFAGGNGGPGVLSMGSFTNQIGGLAFSGSGGTIRMVPTASATSTVILSATGAVVLNGAPSTLDLTSFTPNSSIGLYRLVAGTTLTSTFATVTGLTDPNYVLRYGSVNANELDLQRKADQAATFTMTTGTVTRALVNTNVTVSGTVTNTSPVNSTALTLGLASTGLTGSGFTTGSVVPGASTAVSGTLAAGSVAGTQNWTITNTDANAITTTSTATGSLTVVNNRTFSTGTIAFGRFLNTTNPLSGTSSITSTGLSGTTANSTLGAFGTSNGLTLSLTGGTSAFTGLVTTQTATYTTSGGYSGGLGSVSGAFSGTATNEFGGTSGVTVNYTGTSVAQRTFTTGTSTLALGFVHQGGSIGSPTVVVTSTGLNNVTANATLGSFSGGPAGFSLGLTGGSAEFLGSSGTQTATYTLAGSTASLGAISGTFSSAVSAEFGSIPNVAVAVTGNVYSGQSTWATNGGGNWGTFSGTGANAFGGNWGENQGSPGLDPSFANTDTATFGSALTGGTAAINTAGANISLKALTFNNAAGSYELSQTGGSGPLALLAAGTNSAAIDVLAGSHAIHAAVGLGSNTVVDVASGAALTFSNAISGSAFGLTKTGLGALTLTGTSTFTGPTSLDAGSLLVNGSLASDVIAAASTALGGSGSIAGVLSGAGLVSPGNSPGILTAGGFDPTGGLDAAFEFTQANPTYNSSTASGNDVLRLTNSSPFVATLGGGNVIDVYFNVDSLQFNQEFTGGFFTGQEAGELLAAVQSAQFNFWFKALSGPGVRTFNNVNYNPLTLAYSDFDGALVETVPVSANFASGTVAGSVTKFIVVPEPGSLALMGVGIALLAWQYRPRRSR